MVTVAVSVFPLRRIAELGGAAGLPDGDVVHQVVAILDRAAVDGDDDVARLEPGLVARATRLYVADQDARLEAVNAARPRSEDRAGR